MVGGPGPARDPAQEVTSDERTEAEEIERRLGVVAGATAPAV